MNQAQEILQSLSEKFAGTASVKQVYGEPIQAGGRTVVPVARVQYFLGGGGGSGEHKGEHQRGRYFSNHSSLLRFAMDMHLISGAQR